MTAVKILRSMYNLTEDSEEDNYIASLLQAPDLNALSLWQATKHSRHNVVKEVRHPNGVYTSIYHLLIDL